MKSLSYVAGFLILVIVAGYAMDGFGEHIFFGILAIIALIFLVELPAIWWSQQPGSSLWIWLLLAALPLIAIAVGGFMLSGFGEMIFFGFAGMIALVVLAELPGAWWMLRGGSALLAGLAIYALPLIIFETREYISWITYCPCGDKELQPFLMVFVYPFLVAVTGTFMLVSARIARPRPAE